MRRLLCATSALALMAASAHAAILTATDGASAYTAAQTAKPGDTVLVSCATPCQLNLWGIPQASPGVAVMPAPGGPNVITGIAANGSSWLTFTGFDIAIPTTGQNYGLDVESNATNLTFDSLKIHAADNATFVAAGAVFRNLTGNSNVVLKNSEISWTAEGVLAANINGVTITNNKIHDVNTDAILGVGMMHTTISYNLISNFQINANSGHPDAIQWATDNNDGPPIPTSYLYVDHNRIEVGPNFATSQIQGVFGEEGDHIWVTNNVVLGTMVNGLADARSTFLTYNHNFLQAYGAPAIPTELIVRQQADTVSITNNALPSAPVVGVPGEALPTNVAPLTGNTLTTPMANTTDYAQVNAWLAAGGDATITPPAPTPSPAVTPPSAAAPDPLQPQLDAATAQIAMDQSTIAGLNGQVTKITNQLQIDDASLAAAQAQVTTLTATVAAAPTPAAIAVLNAQIATLKTQLAAALATNSANQVKSLQAQLNTASTALAAAQAKMSKAKTDNAKVATDLQ